MEKLFAFLNLGPLELFQNLKVREKKETFQVF